MNKDLSCHQVTGVKHFLVDGFKLKRGEKGIKYFLTHFHSDHYGGLTDRWNDGPIYTSTQTAALVVNNLGVDAALVSAVDIGSSITVDDVQVTFIDANHCPGASMLLFRLKDGTLHLHSGDMRYHPSMENDVSLLNAKKHGISKLYLDTTYCHKKHTFQCQEDSIVQVVQVIDYSSPKCV
jgi:DNA cross-link repair 1A protein